MFQRYWSPDRVRQAAKRAGWRESFGGCWIAGEVRGRKIVVDLSRAHFDQKSWDALYRQTCAEIQGQVQLTAPYVVARMRRRAAVEETPVAQPELFGEASA